MRGEDPRSPGQLRPLQAQATRRRRTTSSRSGSGRRSNPDPDGVSDLGPFPVGKTAAMRDPRIERLAELIVGYSLDLQPRDRSTGSTAKTSPSPLVVALYAAAHPARRAPVHQDPPSTGSRRSSSRRHRRSSSTYISRVDRARGREAGRIGRSGETQHALAVAGRPGRRRLQLATQRRIVEQALGADLSRRAAWCGTLYPTQAHAQDAEMSLSEYEEFVYGACHTRRRATTRSRTGAPSSESSAPGRASSRACASCGSRARTPTCASSSRAAAGSRRTGSTTCPTARSSRARSRAVTSGEIFFAFPVGLPRARGRERASAIRGRSRRPRGGDARVRSTCARCSTWIRARRCSARSRSASTTRSTASRATSSSTRRSAGRCTSRSAAASPRPAAENKSGLHWDLICDLRAEGEVYADGELVWQAGSLPLRAGAGGRACLTRMHKRLAEVLVGYSTRSGRATPCDRVLRHVGASRHARDLRRGVARGRPSARRTSCSTETEGNLYDEGRDHQLDWVSPDQQWNIETGGRVDHVRRRDEHETALQRRSRAHLAAAARPPAAADPLPRALRAGRVPLADLRLRLRGLGAGRGHVARGSTSSCCLAPPCSTRTIRSPRGSSSANGSSASETSWTASRELRIVGEDTDLKLGVEGRTWIRCEGPARTSRTARCSRARSRRASRGRSRFSFPAMLRGRQVDDVRLRFEGGEVVEATAKRGQDFLREMVGMDDGARRVGEFAFGLNEAIERVHAATSCSTRRSAAPSTSRSARAYPGDRGREPVRRSTGTWCATCATGGEVYADGELVYRDGAFLQRRRSRLKLAVISDTHMPRGDAAPAGGVPAAAAPGRPDPARGRLRGSCRCSRSCGSSAAGRRPSYGNMDEPALRRVLPQRLVVEREGVRIGIVHDAGPRGRRAARLVDAFPGCDAVVYGHTHVPEVDAARGRLDPQPRQPDRAAPRAGAHDDRDRGWTRRKLVALDVRTYVLLPWRTYVRSHSHSSRCSSMLLAWSVMTRAVRGDRRTDSRTSSSRATRSGRSPPSATHGDPRAGGLGDPAARTGSQARASTPGQVLLLSVARRECPGALLDLRRGSGPRLPRHLGLDADRPAGADRDAAPARGRAPALRLRRGNAAAAAALERRPRSSCGRSSSRTTTRITTSACRGC